MVLGAVLIFVGAFVVYRGARDRQQVLRLRRHGRQAIGTVTGHGTRAGGGRSVIVSYTDESGTPRRLTSPLSSSKPTLPVGAPATVRYLPGDPASATIDERREHIGSLVLTVILGLGFGVAGVFLAFDRD